LASEEIFRRPLTRLEGPAERAALEAELKQVLSSKVDNLSFQSYLAKWIKSRP
jgi:hypothetical protein